MSVDKTTVDGVQSVGMPLLPVPTKTSFTEPATSTTLQSTPQPTSPPSNINGTTDLVMVLPTSFDEINKKWNEFSLDIMSMLESSSVQVQSLNIMRDASMM